MIEPFEDGGNQLETKATMRDDEDLDIEQDEEHKPSYDGDNYRDHEWVDKSTKVLEDPKHFQRHGSIRERG